MHGDLDVYGKTLNYGEIYGESQGFLFKYNDEVFWRFIVRWTEGLGRSFDSAGWWLGDGIAHVQNMWNAPSTSRAEHERSCSVT